MCRLVPLRVDVSLDNNKFRLVDTLLLDPQVLPVRGRHDHNDVAALVDANATYLARQMVTDAEVQGVTRQQQQGNNKTMIGRTELLTLLPQLVPAVADQLRQQLWAVLASCDGSATAGDALLLHQIKRRKLDHAGAVSTAVPATSSASVEPNQVPSAKSTASAAADAATDNDRLVPIHLRLSVHGVRIHDDFLWDVTQHQVGLLAFAAQLGRDLMLTPEATQAVAIDMAEQLHGLSISSAATQHDQRELDEGGPDQLHNITAAWTLEQKTHITNVAHLVAQHRKP